MPKPIILFACMLLLAACSKKETIIEDQALFSTSPTVTYLIAGKIDTHEKVDITSKITGKVLRITKDIGEEIKENEPLVMIDMQDTESQLASAQKHFENAKINEERSEKLFKEGNIALQQKESAEYQYTAAKAALDQAQNQYDSRIIKSPITGTISARNINKGEMVTPGLPLLSVVNTNSIYVNASIPEFLINKLHEGMQVHLKITELSDQLYTGVVTVIDPVIDDKSKTSLAKIKIINADNQLKPGMFVLVGIDKRKS